MGRPKQFTAFGEYLAELCREAGTTPSALAKATKSSPSVLTYSMRRPTPGIKAYPPPLKYLNGWCDALGLANGGKRQRLLVLAWLEHAPEPLKVHVAELEARLSRLEGRTKR